MEAELNFFPNRGRLPVFTDSARCFLLQRTLKASGAAGMTPQRRRSSSATLFGRMAPLVLQTNGKRLENRAEHTQLWNKGKGVLEVSKGVAADIRRSLSQMKDRIVDKLVAVPFPAEALDNARQSLESIVKDVTQAAQGLTKEAVHRIKIRLAEILPFLSPNQTGKEAGIQGFGLGSMGTGANDGEVLDEMITRSRGEVKHTYSRWITSSSDCTTIHGSKCALSPQIAEAKQIYSPRISEIRQTHSPHSGEKHSGILLVSQGKNMSPSAFGLRPHKPTSN